MQRYVIHCWENVRDVLKNPEDLRGLTSTQIIERFWHPDDETIDFGIGGEKIQIWYFRNKFYGGKREMVIYLKDGKVTSVKYY